MKNLEMQSAPEITFLFFEKVVKIVQICIEGRLKDDFLFA